MRNSSFSAQPQQLHRLKEFETRSSSEEPFNGILVVWVHQFRRNKKTRNVMRAYLRTVFPGADLLMPIYHGGFRNTNAFWVAAELQDVIARAFDDAKQARKEYSEVILVGYSAGALLIRKALAYGLGELQDHPFPELGRTTRESWEEIAKKCRVVLLAGINRGWSFEQRPVEMHRLIYPLVKMGLGFLRLLPLGRFILSLERGSPFVANLRLQWMNLSRKDRVPPVVQLLGGQDGIVRQEDNKDVLVSKDFIFVPVPFANHKTIVDFSDKVDGHDRENSFRESLTHDISTLRRKYQLGTEALKADKVAGLGKNRQTTEDNESEETNPEHLIFLIHGIRDNADWPRELAKTIRAESQKEHPLTTVRCVTSSYGHFPMLHFLLFKRRKKNVRWFMDRYTEELAKSPHVQCHYVGHSNGTYLLAEGLRTYKAMEFNRVAFMGSVVPSNFAWRQYYDEGRIKVFRNDRAAKDWIVGIFPGFYQLMGKLLPIRYFLDIGDGGFRGFDQSVGQFHTENYYFKGGHGKATESSNHLSLARFILGGEATADPQLLTEPNAVCVYLSRLNWLIWLILILIVGGTGIFIYNAATWQWVVAYGVFLMMVMFTI